MKRKFKLFCSMILSLSLIAIPVQADASGSIDENDHVMHLTILDGTSNGDAGEVDPLYVPCPQYAGKHAMMSKGIGMLYAGPPNDCSAIFTSGCTYQCQYCKLVLVCQREPSSGRLGYYATQATSENVSNNGTVLYKDPLDILYNSNLATDPIFAGFEFYI